MAIWQPRAMEKEACLSSDLDVMEYVRSEKIYNLCKKIYVMEYVVSPYMCSLANSVVELISHKLIHSPTSLIEYCRRSDLFYCYMVSRRSLFPCLICLCQFWALSLLAPVLSCLPSSHCWKDTSNQAVLKTICSKLLVIEYKLTTNTTTLITSLDWE